MLYLSLEANGEYTLHSITFGPNTCAKAGKYEFEAPEGHVPLKEARPVTLYIDTEPSNYCFPVQTPVFHTVPNIKKVGPSNLLIEVFIVFGGEVKGKQIIHFDQASDSKTIEVEKAKNTVTTTTYSLSGNGLQIILSMKEPNETTISIEDKDPNDKRTYYSKEIYRDETKLGLILSVVLEHIPDLHLITLSLLVPNTNRPIELRSVDVKTYAVRTKHLNGIIKPSEIKGQVQFYETLSLVGNAW